MRLSEAIDAFLSAKEPEYSYNTLYNYKLDFRQLSAFLGDVAVSDVGLSDILAWRAFHGFRGNTWSRKVASVRALFDWLLQRNIVGSSPVADYVPTFSDKRRIDALSDEDVATLLRFEADDVRDIRAKMIALLCLDGLQSSDIFSLMARDVNTELGIVAIGTELLPLSSNTIAIIKRWLDIRLEKGPQVALLLNVYGSKPITMNRFIVYNELRHLSNLIFGDKRVTVRRLHATFLSRLVRRMPGASLRRLAAASGRDLRRMYAVAEKWGGNGE